MSGPFINEHGDVMSSALEATPGFNAYHRIYEEFRMVRGQIQQIYQVDDADNNQEGKGVVTLYDVLVWLPDGGTELIRRCRALQPFFGGALNNFLEVIPPDPGVDANDSSIDSKDKRGTHVLVGYISGYKNSGVILGSLPHPGDTAVSKRPKGDVGTYLEGEFQGVNWNITNEGELKLTLTGPKDDTGEPVDPSLGPTEIIVNKDMSLKISTNQKQSFEIDRVKKTITTINGDVIWKMEQTGSKISVKCKDLVVDTSKDASFNVKGKATIKSTGDCTVSSDSAIKLAKTDGAASEPYVLGNMFKDLMTEFLNECANIKVIGNLGTPTPPPMNAAKFKAIIGKLDGVLSQLIKGVK